jgi:hypothetical protein
MNDTVIIDAMPSVAEAMAHGAPVAYDRQAWHGQRRAWVQTTYAWRRLVSHLGLSEAEQGRAKATDPWEEFTAVGCRYSFCLGRDDGRVTLFGVNEDGTRLAIDDSYRHNPDEPSGHKILTGYR